jgi:hypothetical protein
MFVNAALIRPGYQPGQYPSAGPLPHLIDVWRAAAPAIDFLAPDIYFPTFIDWTRRYVRGGNPLFIPEALRSPDAAVNALYAVATHDAMGFSPFAIESIGEPSASLLGASYDTISQLTPLIIEHALNSIAIDDATFVSSVSPHEMLHSLAALDRLLTGVRTNRHIITAYPISRISAGYVIDVWQDPRATVGLGVARSWNRIAGELRTPYGDSPAGVLGFVQLTMH